MCLLMTGFDCPEITWCGWQDAKMQLLTNQPDRAVGKATLGRSEVLKSLRHYPRAQSQGHHTIDRLEERDSERGSTPRSSLKGRERAIVSQTNTGTVSKATFGTLLRDGVEQIEAFPDACMSS